MREQAQTQPPSAEHDRVLRSMDELILEALRFIPQARVEETVRRWLPYRNGSPDVRDETRILADALGFATDLVLFTPSTGGMTAIDRLARHQKPKNRDEAAAMEALRQTRFRVMRVEEREDRCVVRLLDLASGESLRVLSEHIPASCAGLSLAGRTARLGAGTYALVGPITPLDEAARAVALGFMRPDGKRLSNPQRCAEAVYRHVMRHAGLEIPGLNRPPDDEREDDPFADETEDGELDAIARRWAKLDPDVRPSADAIQRVRDATSLDTVLDVLVSSVLAREHRRDRLADAYARIAATQVETIRLREANGISGLSLTKLSSAIAHAIARHGMPVAVRRLFEDLQRRGRPAASTGAPDADLERLVQRIQGLRAKTVEQGCTEQEALTAAEKVAELLDRYGLSLSTIELHRQACQGVGIDTGRRRLGPVDECVPTIAAFFDCRAWSEKSASAPIRHIFFGLRADVEAAHYLYDLVELAFATETAVFTRGELYVELGSGERRSATHSFQIGLGRGIIAKLHSSRQAREAALSASSGRELVPIKTSVIEGELAKLGLHFRSRARPTKRYVMTDAYEAGEVAGRRFEYREALAAGD